MDYVYVGMPGYTGVSGPRGDTGATGPTGGTGPRGRFRIARQTSSCSPGITLC